MYPDRSVTYVPGLYPLLANHRMKLPEPGRRLVLGLAPGSRSLQLMRGRWVALRLSRIQDEPRSSEWEKRT